MDEATEVELRAALVAERAALVAERARSAELEERIAKLEKQLAKLLELLGQDSSNSNKPPSSDPVLSQNSIAPVRPHKSGPGGDSQQRVRARQHWPYGLGLWRLLRMTERLFPLYAAWRW